MSNGLALVIGASGGIGQELVKQLRESERYEQIYAVSRSLPTHPLCGVTYKALRSDLENEVADYCQQLKQDNKQFSLVVCCIGALQGHTQDQQAVMPEKKWEDINADNLNFYMHTNVVLPALWLKHSTALMKGKQPAKMVFFSARVGSISDNKLGGWYGYRASKSALNMLIKSAQIECHRRAKNVCLVSYHPGTVDTALSKPFQSNVKPEKLFSPEFSVSQLLKVTATLTQDNGPHYLDWQGQSIPW